MIDWFVIVLGILFSIPSLASPTPNPTLESLVRSSWAHSLMLEAQKDQAEMAESDRYRRFIFNEPTFSVADLDNHGTLSYGLSLTTAFPGKTVAFTRLDTAKAHSLQAEYSAKKYELSKAVVQSYLDCASARETHRVQLATSNDLDTLFHSLKAIYENGHSTQAEKIGAELQARQAHLDLLTAEDREKVLCQKLNKTLVNLGLENGVNPDETSLPDDLDSDLIKELGGQTADQARSIAGMEIADANSSTAWWTQLPDLTFGVNRNHYVLLQASPVSQEWTTSFSVSITLPLLFPFHETVEASRAKSQAVLDRKSAELQKIAADSDHTDGSLEYRRNKSRLREVREKDLPLAEALVDSTYSAYQSGKLGYAELVLSRRTLSDIKNQDIQLRVSVINAHLRCLNQCEETP